MAFAEAPPAPPPPAPNLAPPAEERGNIPAETPEQHAEALGDAFADLDRMVGEPEAPAGPAVAEKPAKPEPPTKTPSAPEKEAKPGEPQRGPDGKFLPKKDEPKKDEPKPDDKPPEVPVEKMAPKQLREAYEALRKKHAALEQERQKAAAAPPAEPQEDPEKKALGEKLTEREKRLQLLEEELKYSAYERSQEYQEKYQQPFISAWQTGQERAAKLKVVERKNDLEEVVSPARQGTADDFDNLMLKEDDDEAAEWAVKTFGNKAPLLLYHRERVQEANNAKHKALEEFRKSGTERDKQRTELINNHTKAVRDLYHKAKDEGMKKYPQFFEPDPADPKTKTLRDKGMRLADRAMGAPDEENEKPLSTEEKVKLQAAMRNCFGGFQMLAYRYLKEQKLRAELETKLAQYEASEPKGGDGKGGGRPAPAAADESPDQAFDAVFKR